MLVSLVSFLPFAPGLLAGRTFFYRDLGNFYFPTRAFVMDGLQEGELRYWNPYVHEGELVLPFGNPLELLQIPFHDEQGLSWFLALHVSLAAVTALTLGRGLGMAPFAASGLALVYALGGFMLSGLNLVLHLQGGAWAPLLVLALTRAATGGPRAWALASVATGLCLSSLGVEVVAQAALLGVVLALSRQGLLRRLGGIGTALLLGAGLAAPVALVLLGQLPHGARGGGWTPT